MRINKKRIPLPAVVPGPIRKKYLDQRVSSLLGEKIEAVALVTETFLSELTSALLNEHEVRLDRFGTFRVRTEQDTNAPYSKENGELWKYFVSFKKSEFFKKAFQEHNKEKPRGKIRSRRTGKRAGEEGKHGVPNLREETGEARQRPDVPSTRIRAL